MGHITIVPAYGRDYKSSKAAKEDYFADIDFLLRTYGREDGRPINRSQILESYPQYDVNIRYRSLRSVCVVKPGDKAPAPKEKPLASERIPPGRRALERMILDGIATATDGCEGIEADGTCEHGCEAWPLHLGLV